MLFSATELNRSNDGTPSFLTQSAWFSVPVSQPVRLLKLSDRETSPHKTVPIHQNTS